MSLQQKLYDDLKQAFIEKKEPNLSTLRLLKSDIQYELTKTGDSSLPDEVILQLIKKNIARRRETAEEYKKAGKDFNDYLAEEYVLEVEAQYAHGLGTISLLNIVDHYWKGRARVEFNIDEKKTQIGLAIEVR